MGKTLKNTIILILIIIGALFAWYFFRIIIYLIISAVLSVLGQPIVQFLQRIKIRNFRMPAGVSALLTLFFMMMILILFISFVFPLMASQAAFINQLDVAAITKGLEEPLLQLENFLRSWAMLAPGETIGSKLISELIDIATFDRFSNFFNSVLNLTAEIFFGFLAISFITFFFLKEKNLFSSIIIFFTPYKHRQDAREILFKSKYLLRRYFLGLISDLTLVFLLISFCMWIIGLPNALVIGFFAGILNIIPYVGPIIATFLGVLLGISVNLHLDFYTQMLPMIIAIFASFIIVNTIDVSVFQPMIYSKSVKAHPLEIFIIFMVAGMIGGVFGMIVAIPSYSVLRIFVIEFFSKSKLIYHFRKEFEEENPKLSKN
ncbi:MAG: AI-2E family transporter [Bacteroidota bacterium]